MKRFLFGFCLVILLSACGRGDGAGAPNVLPPMPSRTPFQPLATFTPTAKAITQVEVVPSVTPTAGMPTLTVDPSPTLTPEPSLTSTPEAILLSATFPATEGAIETPFSPTVTASQVVPPQEYPTPIPGVMIGNLHTHTICSDGNNSYEEMIQEALHLGFNFVAITDHSMYGVYIGCTSQTDCPAKCATLVEKCRSETRLLCFPSTEISGRAHVLAIGIAPGVLETRSIAEQVAQIHAQGGLAIAAHPFTLTWPFSDQELFDSGLDGMECIPGARVSLDEQQRLSAGHSLPCVYTSDAHDKYYLRMRYMSCSQSFSDVAGLKSALDAGACTMITPTPKTLY
jgi:hypothetical protein